MDHNSAQVETVRCGYCDHDLAVPWAEENGYKLGRCVSCGYLYVNPRPVHGLISEAVETGIHTTLGGHNVIGHRHGRKVLEYKKKFAAVLPDVWRRTAPLSWLDVGAGHGEIVEALTAIAPRNSRITGLEPMKPKADSARSRNLEIINGYTPDITGTFQFVSLIQVFSHLPDFRQFLHDIKRVMEPGSEFVMETGNIADLENPSEVVTDLDLPDHLHFAGRQHVIGFLEQAGFTILSIHEWRRDGVEQFSKNLVKKALGRQVNVRPPYTSSYRNLMFRAKLS